MKQLTEAQLKNKSELGEFEQCFLRWLKSHGNKGTLNGSCRGTLENTLFKQSEEDFEYELENTSWYGYGGEMLRKVAVPYIKSLLQSDGNPFALNDDYDLDFETLTKSYQSMDCRTLIDNLQPQYSQELYRRCKNFWSETKLNTKKFKYDKRGMISIERAIAIPKRGINNNRYSGNYEEYLNENFEGIGKYWSYSTGEILFWDELSSYDGHFTLYIKAYAPFDSISVGDTMHTWGEFDTEEEITLQRGKPVEIYKIIVYDSETKERALLPIGGRIVINA